jgi:predicted nicotinamide N-methyase
MDSGDILARELARVVPGATLGNRTLCDDPPLRLLLLRDTAAGRALDSDVARRVMDNPLYWIFCWASGRVLARYLLQHPSVVSARRVLDFGCGSGVVAIAAALAGAREVIACDLDDLALTATRHNAGLNDVSVSLSRDFDNVDGDIDLILAADVLYDPDNLPWLQRFVDRAPEVIVADSRLRNFRHAGYQRIAQFESSTLPDLDESREFNRVTLYRGCR